MDQKWIEIVKAVVIDAVVWISLATADVVAEHNRTKIATA